ncbi:MULTISPECIES: metallophosphoesterase family protein [Bacillus cereus group]|uniref:metallophosphoesterase family protein n=1 Tax=Bacillus cereus group TaxID=86661 RepID=UPI001681015D|nr:MULTISPECIES: metallophosphoesterase [Bacillus cereus group]MCU5596813.1 metallophosphoesterase [Bacillus wiedmannii]
MKVHFIQLSDIHFQYKNYNIVRMRDLLTEYLGELNQKSKFDFVVVTGDITHQAQKYNNEIIEFLDEVLRNTNLTKENMYIIPGNHDVNRLESVRGLLIDGVLGKEDPSNELDDSVYPLLLKGQDDFFEFYNSYLGEEYPKEALHFIKKNEKYNVFHINTCLISGKDGEEGNLLIDMNRFYKAIKELRRTKDEKLVNIAIGHHTLECILKKDREAMRTNFIDSHIDLYLSGHVHDPSYNFSLNHSDTPFLELVSGAAMADEYATPGFVEIDVDLESGKTNVVYHTWSEKGEYWTVNTQVGRKAKEGVLEHTIERLNKKKVSEVLAELEIPHAPFEEVVDENEFKQFIIELHESIASQKPIANSLEHMKDLEEKFINMACSTTFQINFELYSRYFSIIEQIMSSTSYVSSDKKELVIEEIVDKYLLIHHNYKTGDEIFVRVAELITQEYASHFSYSKLQVKRYAKILTSWVMYKCWIFNDDKREKVI